MIKKKFRLVKVRCTAGKFFFFDKSLGKRWLYRQAGRKFPQDTIKKIIAFAVDRFCEILPGKKLKKEIFKEITRRSLGCTGKIAELNGSKLRGVNLSLVKLDDSVRELEKEENKIDRVIYLSF